MAVTIILSPYTCQCIYLDLSISGLLVPWASMTIKMFKTIKAFWMTKKGDITIIISLMQSFGCPFKRIQCKVKYLLFNKCCKASASPYLPISSDLHTDSFSQSLQALIYLLSAFCIP